MLDRFNRVAESSLLYRCVAVIDQASDVALSQSIANRFIDFLLRVARGSSIIQLFSYKARGDVLSTSLALGLVARCCRFLSDMVSRTVLHPGRRFFESPALTNSYARRLGARFFRVESGVLFLVLFIPIEVFLLQYLPRPIKYVVELTLLAMTIGILLSAVCGRKRLRRTPLDLPVVAFAGTAVLSGIVNEVPLFIMIAGIRALLQFYLLYFVVVQSDLDRSWLKRLVIILLALGVFLAVFGLAEKLLGFSVELVDVRETTIEGRILSTFGNPNNFGGFLLFVIPTAIALCIQRLAGGVRLLAGGSALIMLSALVLTYSRGAWMGLAIAVIFLAFLHDRRILMGISMALIAVLVAAPNVIDRLAFGFSGSYLATSSTGGRILYWTKAMNIAAMSPFFGAGPGRFGGSVAAIFGTPVNALVGFAPNFEVWVDSQVFQVLAELGLVGLVIFLWVPFIFVKEAAAYAKTETDPFWRAFAIGSIGSIAGITIQSMVVGVWETHQIAAFFWLTMAIVMSLMFDPYKSPGKNAQ